MTTPENMAESPPSIGEISQADTSENGIVPEQGSGQKVGEPSVVLTTDIRRGGLGALRDRFFRRDPKPQVLVASGELPDKRPYLSKDYDPNRKNEYVISAEGDEIIVTDPKADNQEVARFPRVAGEGIFGKGRDKNADKQNPQAAQATGSNVTNTQQEAGKTGEGAASPIPGLTAEEVELFVANGITVEDLKAVIDEHGFKAFEVQARESLKKFRELAEAVLTPEQIAERRAEEQAKKIKQLEAEQEELKNMPTNNQRERDLKLLRQARIKKEYKSILDTGEDGATGGGGDNGVPGGPESEEEPQLPDDLEYEASPERGRQITREIMKWETLRADGKYSEVDWQKLNDAYLDQEIHMEAVRLVSLEVKLFEPEGFSLHDAKILPKFDKEAFEHIVPLADLIVEYNRGNLTEDVKKGIDRYFEEAEKLGLLKDLYAVLLSANKDVRQGISRKQDSTQITPLVDQKVQIALRTAAGIYRHKKRSDPNLSRLEAEFRDPETGRVINRMGIWELYAQFAMDRFAAAIDNQELDVVDEVEYLPHEYRLREEGDEIGSTETYWKLEHGWYINIYAETEEEFMIAADSYISRLQSITSDAKKMTQEASQFIDILVKSEGAKKLLETKPEFITKLIWGIEARVGVFGADDANERYNAEDYKAFLDFINKDGKGPDRWLVLAQLLDGLPTAALMVLDKDPRWELMFALYGSRGQLAKMSFAQRDREPKQGLYYQLYNQFAEEMLGVRIKDKRNIDQVTKFMTDDKFVSIFDGLYRYGRVPEGRAPGDANIRFYEDLQKIGVTDENDRRLTADQRRIMKLGRIQKELKGIREKIDKGEIKLKTKKGTQRLENAVDLLQSEADQKLYIKELNKAKKAVDIALQIYGTTGEKSKRGGGVFKVLKVDVEGNEYEDFIPIHYAEKFVQFAETWTKMKYADDSAIWKDRELTIWNDSIARAIKKNNIKNGDDELKNFKAQYRTAKVAQAREKAIEEFAGKEETPDGRRVGGKGFESRLYEYDDKGKILRPMKLKRPKENPQTGEVIKVNGQVEVEEVDVDFHTATHHAYGNWSGHTYWSYQEEHRHLLLSPTMFDQARKIRDGQLRPEDADPVAVQLLVLDPTLRRVRRFVAKNFEERERKLTMAAIEDSYQSHWRITRELYRAFFPKYGTPTENIGIYYGLQDFGGFRKMIEHSRARAAEDPERFARRGRRLIPDLQIPAAALSEYMGQGTTGVLGPIRMMGYSTYRLLGTFAWDKFSAQSEIADKESAALFSSTKDNEGNLVEALLLKLTNESDTLLQEFKSKLPRLGEDWIDPGEQQEFCVALRKSFGRLEKYLKLFTTMETLIRNASGAADLEGIDVLTDDNQFSAEAEERFAALPNINFVPKGVEDGETPGLTRSALATFIQVAEAIERLSEAEFNAKFNKGVDKKESGIDEGKISTNTGSGRHSARIFFDAFMKLMLESDKKGRSGVDLYQGEEHLYRHLNDKIIFYDADASLGVGVSQSMTIRDWLFGKMVPT